MTRIAAEFSDSRSNRDAVDVGIARAGAAAAAKRRELGITQRSLARDGVINAGALIAFEKGRSWPRRQTRIRLEQVLGWPPGTISGIRSGGPAPLLRADPLRPASQRLGSSWTDIIEQPVEDHTLALLVGAISTAVTTANGGIAALPRPDHAEFSTRAIGILVGLRELESSTASAERFVLVFFRNRWKHVVLLECDDLHDMSSRCR